MKKIFIPLILVFVMCFQVAVFATSDLPIWCRSTKVPDSDKNRTQYRASDDFVDTFFDVYGTTADSVYISSAFEHYFNENSIDYKLDNVLSFDYTCVTSAGSHHSFYYFIPTDANIDKNDLFLYVSPSNGMSYGEGSVYSKSTKEKITGTFYRGFLYCQSAGSYAYVFIDKNSSSFVVDDLETYNINSDIACYLNVSSLDDVFNGVVQPDNMEDILPKRYGAIEPPQDLRLTDDGLFSDNKTTFTWTQKDKNYKLWETEIMIHADLGYKLTIDLFGSFNRTGNLLLKTDVVKTSDMHYSVILVELVEECRYAYQDIIVEKYGDWLGTHVQLQNCTFSFRNKYSDGQYTYYSNWVKVYIDENENYAIEYEYDDKINGDEGVDYTTTTPSGAVSDGSSYQGDSIKNGSSITNITDFISNGFGLLGNGGIVGLIQHIFSYVPSWIWTLIGSGIGVLVIITIIKLAL